MKNQRLVNRHAVAILAFAGLAASAVAQPGPQPDRLERRIDIVRTEATPPSMPEPPADPVTFLGLEVEPVDDALAAQLKLPPEHGLVVRFVVPDSPAATAGLQKHDVLTRLEDQVLIAPRQLAALVRNRKEGDTVRLAYLRGGSEARASATLAKRVPPRHHAAGTFSWAGASPVVPALPAQQHFIFRGDERPAAVTIGAAARTEGAPHVMIFRPQARIIYSEGDTTLEVTWTESGRQLEARGGDGAVLFTGPIDTPEQRAAVPEALQKHLEKLDTLEPAPFRQALPGPAAMPGPGAVWGLPGPAPTEDVLVQRRLGAIPAPTGDRAL